MVRGLRPALLGRKLRRIELLDPFLLHGCPAEDLARHGRGATVSEVVRRGKWVVVTLAGTKGIIVIQPRMTGSFWLTEPDRPGHIRLVFHLEKPRAMVWFCDTRRLGKIGWYPDADQAAVAFARSHGPDALEIGRDELAQAAQTHRPRDQAGLDGPESGRRESAIFTPTRFSTPRESTPSGPPARLSATQLDRLHRSIGEVLATAITLEGSSFDAGYRTVLGLEGGFLAQNAAYGRAGLPCRVCSQPIVKMKISGLIGRPTYFCPRCQRK